jgi:CspA family cold shock protein
MASERGVVAWFNFKKGFGFIRRGGGNDDVFVHHSSIAVGKPGYRTLVQDAEVEFEVAERNGKFIALNVRPVALENGSAL